MKMKHYLLIGALGIAVTGTILTGCKKKSTTVSTDTTAAQDDANASFVIEDTKNIADAAAKNQASDRVMASGCETISRRDTNNHADSLLDVFFGNTDCTCTDNRTRRGHVLIWYKPGGYFTQGDTIGMGFQNYYVNDIGVTGSRTLINVGKDSAGLYTWNFTANLTLTYPSNGGTATWSSTRTNTLTKVGGVWYYSITGGASGTSRKGSTYNINITSALYVTALPMWLGGCQYIEAGQLTANVSSFSYPVYVTFGTGIGSCNNKASATINGVTYNFTQQ